MKRKGNKREIEILGLSKEAKDCTFEEK